MSRRNTAKGSFFIFALSRVFRRRLGLPQTGLKQIAPYVPCNKRKDYEGSLPRS